VQEPGVSRRSLLKGLAALGAAAAVGPLAACSSDGSGKRAAAKATTTVATGLPSRVLPPGTRPYPDRPEGVDTLPQIEHIVVLMMENHSFDDHFGMLGRGDGFRLDKNGLPRDANPDGTGAFVRAFHMPSGCQLHGVPGQDWNRSHTSWNDGRLDGFVKASTAVAMGYWTAQDLPFYYGLGGTFPLCDRFFCSVLAQTYPNRRFLLAGTAGGIVSTTTEALTKPPPPNGTIFERLNAHAITWRNYYSDLPGVAVIPKILADNQPMFSPIAQFFTDARKGSLPAISYVDPHFERQSEENPQDIRFGEEFASRVINAVMQSPAWPKTMLIWFYDEHGGYYDHVPPPPALKPDDIPPDITTPPNLPGAYDRYGFRVPAVIVSPYARRNYVSHHLHDHTSVLKLIETKWNIGALTYRDANASNLLDSLDLKGRPHFLELPASERDSILVGAT
jgi:phospholipase C